MRTALLLMAFLFASIAARAQFPSCGDCSTGARAVAEALAAMKFDCVHGLVSLQRGYRCVGYISGYTQPVNIFVAPRLLPEREFAVAYFFHGWWTNPKVSPFDGDVGDFGTFVARSGRNLVLVVPQSRGRNSDYGSQLDTSAKVTAFFTNIETVLGHAGLTTSNSTPRLIAGHSGAYIELSRMGDFARAGSVPMLKSLRGAGLLDTAYGYREGLRSLMDIECTGGKGTYFQTFNPADGSAGKRAVNERLHAEAVAAVRSCPGVQLVYLPDPKTSHIDFPQRYLSQFFTMALPQLTTDISQNIAGE